MKKFAIPFFLVGTLAMMYVMVKTGAPLNTPTTQSGILSLEFAPNKIKVDSVLLAWQATPNSTFSKIDAAKINTYWDFVFLFFYAGFLYFSCRKLSTGFREGTGFANAGIHLSKAALVAGALDVVENICMLQSLAGNGSNSLAMVTMFAALIKWLLVIVCVLYIMFSAPLVFYFQKLR